MALAHPGRRDGRAPPLDLLPAPHARAPPGHGAGPDDPAIRASPVGRKAPPRDDAAPLPSRGRSRRRHLRDGLCRGRAGILCDLSRHARRRRDPARRPLSGLPADAHGQRLHVREPRGARRLSCRPTSAPSCRRSRTSSRASRPPTWPSSGTSARKCWSARASSRTGRRTTKPQIAGELARLGRAVPDGVEMGYHLCYGSPADEHLVMPRDTAIMVDIANGFRRELPARRIDFLHVPVPKDRTDAAYFQPLAGLRGFDELDPLPGPDPPRRSRRRPRAHPRGAGGDAGLRRVIGVRLGPHGPGARPLAPRESPRRGRASSPSLLSARTGVRYPMTRPPMTRMLSPVTYDEASEARKTQASAISSGRPSRPRGICLSCSCAPGGFWRNSGYHSA